MACFEGVCEVGMVCEEGTVEACNMLDDDCDGVIDEDLGENPEACNTRDDDCDGITDEGFDSVPEVCNGVDDDCDTRIDEDVPVGVDVCNGADDDCDGTFDEGEVEVCNNLDDDCDGKVDEVDAEGGPPLCGGGLICRGSCQVPSCENDESLACDPALPFCDISQEPPVCSDPPPTSCMNDDDCGTNEVCFENPGSTGFCFDVTPLGETCASDLTCVEGTFCAELRAVGLTGTTCTNTCCGDADCPSGAICQNGFHGARLCVPAAQANTPIDGNCDENPDCASGYCRVSENKCEPVCSTNADCESNESCISTLAFEGPVTTGCLRVDGSPAGASCESNFDCESLVCSSSTDGTCLSPCSAAGQCANGLGCTAFTITGGEFVNLCAPENTDGLAGASCEVNGDCDSLRCHEDVCVAPCCSSAQCGNEQSCRPILVGEQWPTFCLNR